MNDDLRAGEAGARLVLVLSMPRQVGLVMKCLGANFTLELAVGSRMNSDSMTLQVESILFEENGSKMKYLAKGRERRKRKERGGYDEI